MLTDIRDGWRHRWLLLIEGSAAARLLAIAGRSFSARGSWIWSRVAWGESFGSFPRTKRVVSESVAGRAAERLFRQIGRCWAHSAAAERLYQPWQELDRDVRLRLIGWALLVAATTASGLQGLFGSIGEQRTPPVVFLVLLLGIGLFLGARACTRAWTAWQRLVKPTAPGARH